MGIVVGVNRAIGGKGGKSQQQGGAPQNGQRDTGAGAAPPYQPGRHHCQERGKKGYSNLHCDLGKVEGRFQACSFQVCVGNYQPNPANNCQGRQRQQ